MGASKIEEFTDTQNRIADFAKALSHPARVAILDVLLKKKACICGDIVDELPLSQATVSQHLKELKRIGIIQGEIQPPKVCYCINPAVATEMGTLLSNFISNMACCVC